MRFFKQNSIVTKLSIGLLILFLFFIIGHFAREQVIFFEQWIDSLGSLGMIMYLLFMLLLPLAGITQSIMIFTAGSLFGFIQGIAIIIPGTIINSTLAYLLGRFFFSEKINKSLTRRSKLARVIKRAQQEKALQLIVLRLIPLPAVPVCEAMGAAGISFLPFLVSCMGAIPTDLTILYFGYTAAGITKKASGIKSISGLSTVFQLVGLAVLFFLVIVMISYAEAKTHKD